MVDFVSLVYSPWSEKARWALDHHGIDYRPIAYQPMIGELPLRVQMRRFTGTISVPVMKTRDGWLSDSYDIARWAEDHGSGAPLFGGDDTAMAHYNQLSERALDAARALGMQRILGNDEWLSALVPRQLASALGQFAPRVAEFGVRRTLRKYAATTSSNQDHATTLREVLDEVRNDLGGAAEGYLVEDRLTYADIAIAQIFQFVVPANIGGFRLSGPGRDGYRNPELAEAYADLVAWRDWLYATNR